MYIYIYIYIYTCIYIYIYIYTIYNILYADRLKIHRSIYKNIRPNHIKRLPW